MHTSEISITSQPVSNTNSLQSGRADGASDFNTFLTLLTAQMQNQDPLKPMDSTDFVAQLASFSSVEQQIKTNNKLTELLGALTNKSAENMIDWLGKEVRREGSTEFTGQPINVGLSTNPDANSARVIVRNENMETVFTQRIDSANELFLWKGETLSSGTARVGRYSFEVESYSDDTLIETNSGSVFDLVTEVRVQHGETLLVFSDGTLLHSDSALAVRMALLP